MSDDQSRTLRIPDGMKTPKYHAPRTIEVKGETPFIDKKDAKQKQIQRRMIARIKTFNLSDEKDLKEYERIWQMICDGRGQKSESMLSWDATKCAYIAFLRWSEVEFKLPEA